MLDYSGKTVLITGAGSGIGQSTAKAFAATGAALVLVGRRQLELEKTAALLAPLGNPVHIAALDITDEAAVETLFDTVGNVHVAVNAAGVLAVGPLDEIEFDAFSRVFETNVLGLWLMLKYQLRSMKRAGGGSIVNIGSNVGAKLVRPGMGAYAASKAAVSSLTKTAAIEAIAYGIRVNALCPGPVDTALSYRAGEDRAARDARLQATNPSQRAARPEEIANAIVWLASEAADYIVGQEVVMDGGASI